MKYVFLDNFFRIRKGFFVSIEDARIICFFFVCEMEILIDP
jgi:hypothetical protein